MKEDVKEKWVLALTQERYEQGHGCLRYAEDFCCLGVLCDLHSYETGHPWDIDEETYLGETLTPPQAVMEWAGLDREAVARLSCLNDSQRLSFASIAEIIQEEY